MLSLKSSKLKFMAVALAAFAIASCEEDPDGPEPDNSVHKFAYAAQADNGFFVTTFEDFKEGTVSTFDNATTFVTGHLFMEKYGNYVYMMSGSMYGFGGEQTLYKYGIESNGRLSDRPVASLTFPGSPNAIEIVFASENKAYAATCGSRGQLIVFNPSSMTVTGEIDLSSYALEDNDPDAGNGIVRDGKLFMPLNQAKSMMEIVKAPAQVAVIDIEKDKVIKVIEDERVTSLGMVGHTTPVMDEEGNIYFNSGPRSAMAAQNLPGGGYKEGILRIKKGEDEFDKDFYISLQSIEGGETGSYAMHMAYGGNGKIYFFLCKPSLITDPNDQTNIVNKNYVPYELDVKAKTGKILPLPASCGWASSAVIKDGNNIYFGEHTNSGIGFYRYDMTSGQGSQEPVVTTPAGAYKVISLAD